MQLRSMSFLRRRIRKEAGRQWRDLAQVTSQMGREQLTELAREARTLRRSLDKFLHAADQRAQLSRARLEDLQMPGGTDWKWRPDLFAASISPAGIASPEPGANIGDVAQVWHDSSCAAIILRQMQSATATDLAPFKLHIEVMGFEGSYLGLSINLPPEVSEGLANDHVFRVEVDATAEVSLNAFARLNVKHGPNTEELTEALGIIEAGTPGHFIAEFDLGSIDVDYNRLEKIWVDIIVDKPEMNSITIQDLVVSRHPRADV